MNRRLPLGLLPLLLAGCVSSTPASPTDDGGILTGEDSAVPPVDGTAPADSGGNDATIPDGSVADTSTDSPALDSSEPDAADAGPLPVAITVTNDVGPEPGVALVFQSAAGAVIGTATTGATGTVATVLPANSQVTAFFTNASGSALLTVQGVEPGDALTLVDTVNVGYPLSGTPNVSIASLPDASPDADLSLTQFLATAGTCNGNSATLPIGLDVGFPCEVQGKFPLLVEGLNGDGVESAYTYQKGNSILDAGVLDIDVTTPWATDEMAQLVSATNVSISNNNNWFVFTEIAGNVGSAGNSVNFSALSVDGGPLTGSSTFTLHPGYADAVQAESSGVLYTDFTSYQTIAARVDVPDGAPYAFDMSQSLPQITYSNIDTTDAGTASAPMLTWAAAGSLATTDGLILIVPGQLATDAGSETTSWTIVAPPTATGVTPPALPASIGSWTTSVQQGTLDVLAIEASFLTGYAQFRTVAGTLPTSSSLLGGNEGAIAPPLPVEGTLRLTAIGEGD